MESTFERLARNTPVRIIPTRRPDSGAKASTRYEAVYRMVGDCFYNAATEIAKIYFVKIDERYAGRFQDPKLQDVHSKRFGECKTIRNEARNQVLKDVCPLFAVSVRKKDDPATEADRHAHDYIVQNVFDFMVKTYHAWTSEFVTEDQIKSTDELVDNVAAVRREKLERELQNFTFQFRPIVAPPR